MLKPGFSRRTLLLGATGLAAAPVFAQAPDSTTDHRYAVLSIIGDRITLVGFRKTTGSRLDQNEKRTLTVSGPSIERSTLLSVDDAVKRALPKPATVLLTGGDPKLYSLQDAPPDKPGDAAEAVEAIKALLQQSQATRLILVAPYRADARFPLKQGYIGSGKIAGLGIYVDRVASIQLIETGESAEGFIAPYAYFSVSLIDAKSLATIRRQAVTESALIATAEVKTAAEPWDVLSNQKKVEWLEQLVRRGVDRVMPQLLAGA